jgi:hypothetical protein
MPIEMVLMSLSPHLGNASAVKNCSWPGLDYTTQLFSTISRICQLSTGYSEKWQFFRRHNAHDAAQKKTTPGTVVFSGKKKWVDKGPV